MAPRDDGADVLLERPVDVLDASGALVERPRQLVDHPVFRRHDDVRQRAGRGVGARQILRHRGERHEDLVVVRAAVVAVLVLLPNLADHGVRHAVQRDRLVEDVALAEQLLGHVGADDRDARRPALRPVHVKLRPVLQLDGADVLILRLDAGDARGGGVVGALDLDRAALDLRADDGDHRRLRRNRARVVERERGSRGRRARRRPACWCGRPRRCRCSCRARAAPCRCRAGSLRRSPTARRPRSSPRGCRTSSGGCGACWRAGSGWTG